jgi:SAM-dependent methyltransferase
LHDVRDSIVVMHSQSRGTATDFPVNVSYRMEKVARAGVRGDWLDIGCANGGYTGALLAYGAATATGVDPEADRIVQARERFAGDERLRFEVSDGERLPFEDASFDGVLLNEVLEHVESEAQVLAEAHRVLRPGGAIAVMSPNRWFPFEGHGMKMPGNRVLRVPVPILPWLPERLTRPARRARGYWPGQLAAMVGDAGFEDVENESVFPVFERFRWLPAFAIPAYRRAVPWLERSPGFRKFGVSTLVLASVSPREDG